MADDITYTSTNPAGVPNTTKQVTDEHATRGHMVVTKAAVSADGDATLIPATAANGLLVDVSRLAGNLTVIDGGGSISVDDNGGSLTVDGTVAISGSVAVTGPLTDAQLRASAVPVSGTLALSGNVDTELTTADLDTGAGTDTRAVVGVVLAASGGGVLLGAANPLPISDNGGSLTVDGTVAISGSVAVTGPLTDTQLRASAVPVSVASLPLPSGASTEATLALIKAKTDNLDVALSTRTKPADTQVISAASLPLPTGASTSALQTQPGVDIGDVTVNNAAGASSVNIQDGGNSITVDGPLTDTQLRATPVPISGTVSLTGSLDTELTTKDYDTGAGTDTVVAVGILLPKSGGSVAGGTATDPLRVDPTGTTAQPVTDNGGSLTIDGSVSITGSVAVTGPLTDTQLRASAVPVSNTNLDVALSTRLKPADTLAAVTTLGTITNVVHVDDNASTLSVDDGGGSLTIDGTVSISGSVAVTGPLTDTQLRATAVPVSVASLPLPTGSATEAKQDTGNASLASLVTQTDGIEASLTSIDGKTPALGQALAAASTPVVLTAAQITTLTPPAAITGFATEATLSALNGKVTAVNTGAVVVSSSALPSGAATAALQTQPGTDIGDVTINNASGAGAVNIQDGGNSITVDGTVTVTGVATETTLASILTSVQLIDDPVAVLGTATYIEGTTKGNVIGAVRRDANTTLVDTTNEIAPLQVNATGELKVSQIQPLPAGTNAIGKSAANDGVDIGDVTINNASGGSAVNIQDGGNSITVDGTVTITPSGTQTIAGGKTNNNAVPGATNVGALVAVANAVAPTQVEGNLVALRTNLAGDVAITLDSEVVHVIADSGTITNLSQQGGVAISLNTGVRDTGTQRVTIATNDVVPVTDNSGSLTVDAPVGTPAFVRLSDGSAAITTLPVSLASVPSHAVTNAGTFAAQVEGKTAHDGVGTSTNPVSQGLTAVAHGANPTAVAAADIANWLANRAGVPFVMGGHPNIVTLAAAYTAAQTDTAIVTVAGGLKIVVTSISVMCDNANTVDVGVYVGFGTTNTPTTTGVVLTHPGIASGSGVVEGNGSGIIGVGGDGEDLRITCEVPTGGSVRVRVSYYTIES